MDGWIELEERIVELEKEVKFAIFPVTREAFEKDAANMKALSSLERWDYASNRYLEFLEGVKLEKDRNTPLWTRLKNWD